MILGKFIRLDYGYIQTEDLYGISQKIRLNDNPEVKIW
jgi:hypothetical protein